MTRKSRCMKYMEVFRSAKDGRKPDRVALIAPHSHENRVAVPFLNKLAKLLMEDGILVEKRIVRDLQTKGWAFRKRLDSSRLRNEEREKVSLVLEIFDYLTRLRMIVPALSRGSLCLEIHAYDRGNAGPEEIIFKEEGWWNRLAGTDVLIDANERHRKTMFKLSHDPWGFGYYSCERLARLMGYDFYAALEELEALRKAIRREWRRFLAIELPAAFSYIPKSHPMHTAYFPKWVEWDGVVKGLELPHVKERISDFEMDYHLGFLKSKGIRPHELEAVRSVLVLPDSFEQL